MARRVEFPENSQARNRALYRALRSQKEKAGDIHLAAATDDGEFLVWTENTVYVSSGSGLAWHAAPRTLTGAELAVLG